MYTLVTNKALIWLWSLEVWDSMGFSIDEVLNSDAGALISPLRQISTKARPPLSTSFKWPVGIHEVLCQIGPGRATMWRKSLAYDSPVKGL